ncbi:hypothetical protein AgCh_030092 [Apium graveolens]
MKSSRLKFIRDPCRCTLFFLTRAHADFLAIFRLRWKSSLQSRNGSSVELYDENLTKFSLDLDDDRGKDLFLLGCRNNGDAALIQRSDSKPEKILSYDFATKKLKDLGFVGQCSSLARTLPFVKSLVLLNDSDVQRS